jgi:hypothetical protein
MSKCMDNWKLNRAIGKMHWSSPWCGLLAVVLGVGRAGTVRAAGAPTDTWQWYGMAHHESYRNVLPCRRCQKPERDSSYSPN